MGQRRFIRALPYAVLLVVVVMLSIAATPVPRKIASFVMFRGKGIPSTILLTHGLAPGAPGGMGPTDSVATLYHFLQLDPGVSGPRGDTLATFEVAEFDGPTWMALEGKDGKPTRPLRFEEAEHHAKLYVMSTGRVYWMSPAVTPFPYQEGAVTFLSDSGRVFLQKIGVPIPETRKE